MEFNLSSSARLAALLCTHLGMKNAPGSETKELFTFRQYVELCRIWRAATGTGVDALHAASAASLRAVFGKETGHRIDALRRGRSISDALYELSLDGIVLIPWDEDAFPAPLQDASRPFLFAAGDRSLLSVARRAAVVGTRDADDDSLAFARDLGRHCGKRDIVVVSGGAAGVDSSALIGVMEVRGAGIIAMPCGLLTRQARNWLERLEGPHLLLSEVMPEHPFSARNALRRNGMIYKLSQAAVLVSAHKGKGGSWQGACEALKAGSPPLYVRRSAQQGNAALVERGGLWLDKPEIAFFFDG